MIREAAALVAGGHHLENEKRNVLLVGKIFKKVIQPASSRTKNIAPIMGGGG